ncbi:hypothetical protein C7W88_02930 [Novosphingobium sp. THN1]|uniref:hypothetical protein n=1 Tax=Novosphingobium sp. THN1 TaxID=1016987 RepID=UPI000E4ECB31|nr:hypothetical protein [Novosphingobium sp. THN1]AXU18223.1 hypothetical protein C7W88_02930 [Novosphingobium sp. THN1]
MTATLAILALAAANSSAPAGPAAPVQAPDSLVGSSALGTTQAANEDLLLFSVQLDGTTISEALTAYGDPADPLLPLGELTRLLELPLDIDVANGVASGRIGEGQRPITIDLRSAQALIGGKVVALIPPDSLVSETDIYLRASLVAKLLPLKITSIADEMILTLEATEKLPLQAQRERLARMAGLAGQPETQDDAMRVATPYRWASAPAFDFTTELGYNSEGVNGGGRAVTRFEGRVAGDLLKAGFNAWIATDDHGDPVSARLAFTRRSEEGRLLGSLGGTSAALGDVFTPPQVIGARSLGGAGFAFSSSRLDEASVFQRINLRGELPLGYDAELYVNDILRSAQRGAGVQGRYEFNDIPLVRGRNALRVVLYGPRGERIERTRVINVGGGQLAAGKTTVDLGIVSQDRTVIDLSDANLSGFAKGKGDLRATFNIAHGISEHLTFAAGLSRFTDFGGSSHVIGLIGTRNSLLGLAVQTDLASDFAGGRAISLGLAGRIAGVSFLGRHVEYGGGFADEANTAFDPSRPMRRYSEVVFDLAVPLPGSLGLPVSGRFDRAEFVDGSQTLSARARTTANVGQTLFAIGADYSHRTQGGFSDTRINANLGAMRLIDYKWQLRATADFGIKPGTRLETLGFAADRAIGDRYSLRLGATRNFAGRDTALQAGFTARLPMATATLGGDWSTSQNRWRVGVQLNFGIARDPLQGRYRVTPPGPANGASAALLAFIDANANGRRDQGEEAVPGVVVQGGGLKTVTDGQGRAFVTGLGDGNMTSLRADISGTDTVFVAPPPQNITFAARAGGVARIDFPLVPTSELVTRIRFRGRDGALSGLSAVKVRLVSSKGDVASGMTEFDGTVVFDAVKPGKYAIEIDADQAARLGMRLKEPLFAIVGADGRVVDVNGEVAFNEHVQMVKR